MQVFANGKRCFHSFTGFYVIKKTRGKNLIIVGLKTKGGRKRVIIDIFTGSLPSLPRLSPPLLFNSHLFFFLAGPQLPRSWNTVNHRVRL